MFLMRLYYLHIKFTIKAQIQYRTNFITGIFTNFYAYFLIYISISIITFRFKEINGWEYDELVFLAALNLFSYSIASTLLWDFVAGLENYINDGRFDNILIRPIDPIYSMIFDGFSWSGIGQIIVSFFFLFISISNVDVEWTFFKICYIIISIIGSILIQCAALIFFGSLSFWLKKSLTLAQLLFINFRSVINYPISIYGTVIKGLLTFILPWSFINYYPAVFILDKQDPYKFNYLLTPIIGLLFFSFSVWLTNLGIKKYKSVGN